jgi:hypothetical protein
MLDRNLLNCEQLDYRIGVTRLTTTVLSLSFPCLNQLENEFHLSIPTAVFDICFSLYLILKCSFCSQRRIIIIIIIIVFLSLSLSLTLT